MMRKDATEHLQIKIFQNDVIWEMTIVKQGMRDWLGNDGKMMSQINFKLSYYHRP